MLNLTALYHFMFKSTYYRAFFHINAHRLLGEGCYFKPRNGTKSAVALYNLRLNLCTDWGLNVRKATLCKLYFETTTLCKFKFKSTYLRCFLIPDYIKAGWKCSIYKTWSGTKSATALCHFMFEMATSCRIMFKITSLCSLKFMQRSRRDSPCERNVAHV